MELLELTLPFGDTPENVKLPDPNLLFMYRGMETRDIWLDTEISLETCSLLIQYIQYLNKRECADLTPITLHIASPGGELSVMFMLYHTITNSVIPIHTINEGGAHSAAFIVFLAGAKRAMNPDVYFVAHEGSGMMGGSFRENKFAMRQYEKDVKRMKEIIANHTKLTLEEIEAQFEREQDWYIGYDDAKKFGIITE